MIKRLISVPAKGYDVVMRRPPHDTTRPRRLIVASYNDAQTAQQQADARNRADTKGMTYYSIATKEATK